MKRKNKKGQAYLIGSLIILTIIMGIVTLSDSKQTHEFIGIDILAEEIDIESTKVLEFLTYNNLVNKEQIIKNFHTTL